MPPDLLFTMPLVGMFFTLLLTVGLIALALHLLFAWKPVRRASEHLADLSPVTMTLCGTVFGLSVAFLANSVWAMEDRARETVNAEARSIRVMQVYVSAMTASTQDSFARILQGYGQAVAREWDDMADMGPSADAESRLRHLYAAVLRGFSEGEQNRAVQQRLLTALDSLSTARQQRLSIAQDVVSIGQWFLVTALGLLLLVVIAIGHARFPVPRTVALASMTMAITIALYVIAAHDRPFIGPAAQSPWPILDATGVASE
ncbi:hypothetical protein [Aestuariivirga sp.]|uniref:bestrophin-like domain n=1 Tax=Aestuariivirga sp. TaxID=2650926 RepID=UPI0035941316